MFLAPIIIAALLGGAAPGGRAARPDPTYRVTADTEVTLDGRACAFRAVPATARVVRMAVTPDGAVVRVEFRSR